MPRSKPIPPQILQMVEHGDLPSLRRLERLISPGNVTEEIFGMIFKCLTSHPVPVTSDWVNEFVLKTGVGSRPSACLCVFWKIFDLISREGGKSKLEPTLLKHLLESGDVVLGWTRVCLQSGLPCVPDDMLLEGYSPRANRYLTVAHHLLMLLKLDEDYRAVMLSSTAFINLFLELWLVEDCRDRSGNLTWRMINSKDFFGCSIIDLADTILLDSTSREIILKRCVTAQQRDLFSRALMDRVTRGWEGDKISLVGWTRSLDRLVSITSVLCQESHRFRRILTQNGHLSQLCTELWGCSEDILGDFEMNFLVRPLLSSLTNLVHLALLDNPSSFRHHWKHIVSGDFIEALFGATLMTCTREDDKERDEKLDAGS